MIVSYCFFFANFGSLGTVPTFICKELHRISEWETVTMLSDILNSHWIRVFINDITEIENYITVGFIPLGGILTLY